MESPPDGCGILKSNPAPRGWNHRPTTSMWVPRSFTEARRAFKHALCASIHMSYVLCKTMQTRQYLLHRFFSCQTIARKSHSSVHTSLLLTKMAIKCFRRVNSKLLRNPLASLPLFSEKFQSFDFLTLDFLERPLNLWCRLDLRDMHLQNSHYAPKDSKFNDFLNWSTRNICILYINIYTLVHNTFYFVFLLLFLLLPDIERVRPLKVIWTMWCWPPMRTRVTH